MEVKGVEWNPSTYEEFQQYLFSIRSEKYQAFHQKLVPTNNNIIGIQLPVLRKLAKELSKGNMEQFLKVMKHTYNEENMIHGFLVGELCNNKSYSLEEKFKYIKEFLPHIDNWGVCDSFCTSLKIASRYPAEFFQLIRDSLQEDKEYYKRFGFVMLLEYYLEEQYMPSIFEYCTQYNNDQYYVQMAVAWLLSMCYVKERETTLAFLRQNTLDDFTYKKTISKIVESNQISKEEKQWIRSHLKK